MNAKTNKVTSGFWYLILLFILLAIDRFTKQGAIKVLAHQNIAIMPGFRLTLLKNRGISWGMLGFENPTLYFIISFIIASIVVCLAVYTYFEYKKGVWIVPEICILAGALSNLYDRIYYSGVIDFIELYIGNWSWPVFNVADALLVIGVFLIFVRSMKKGVQ